MSKMKTMPSTTEPRVAPVPDTPNSSDTGSARPPESAENFEHVLRRLIAERDRRAEDA